ncbi:MAG: hypothetical protein JXR65_09120 [Bacteroidales bacterium]|nr:hypothetical protein [Bacteroidales bacterium]
MIQKISDIYIYCDRWCERCAFGSLCEAYNVDDRVQRSKPLSFYDEENKLFWQSIDSHYDEVVDYLKKRSISMGASVDEFESMKVRSSFGLFHGKVIKNPLFPAGRTYEDMVDDLLDSLAESGKIQMKDMDPGSVFQFVSDELPEEEIVLVNHWLAVVMRYQLQLFLKISRVFYIQGKEEQNSTEIEDLPSATGTAKTVKEMMSRSLVAWFLLKDYFPEVSLVTNGIMLHLYRMIRKVEADFPDVDDFVRIGLDE